MKSHKIRSHRYFQPIVILVSCVLIPPSWPSFSLGQPSTKPGVYALIIGVTQYPGNNNLKHAVPLANEVETSILSTYRHAKIFKFLNQQATRAAIEQVLFEEFPKAPDHSLLIVYFAGHGLRKTYGGQTTEISDSYLLLHGATDVQPWGKAVRGEDLIASIRRGRRCNWFVLLDCCYSGKSPPSFFQMLEENEQKILGVRAVIMTASDSREQTLSGLFTKAVFEVWKKNNDNNICLTPEELYSKVRDKVLTDSRNLIAPDLVIGRHISVCMTDLVRPGFLLICEPKFHVPSRLDFYLDDASTPHIIRYPNDEPVFFQNLDRDKSHKLKVLCQNQQLLNKSNIKPNADEDFIILQIEGPPDNVIPVVSYDHMARVAITTARAVEAYGANPASLYYRAATYAANSHFQSELPMLLQKTFHYSSGAKDSLAYKVSGVAIGKMDFKELNDEKVATALGQVGQYSKASEAFAHLLQTNKNVDKTTKAKWLYGWTCNGLAGGMPGELKKIKATIKESNLQPSTNKSMERLFEWNKKRRDGTPLGHPFLTPPTMLNWKDEDTFNKSAWRLEVLPVTNNFEKLFYSEVKNNFQRMHDPNAALTLHLAAINGYLDKGMISKDMAKDLAMAVKFRWSKRVGLFVSGSRPDLLSTTESALIERSTLSREIMSRLKRLEIKTNQ